MFVRQRADLLVVDRDGLAVAAADVHPGFIREGRSSAHGAIVLSVRLSDERIIEILIAELINADDGIEILRCVQSARESLFARLEVAAVAPAAAAALVAGVDRGDFLVLDEKRELNCVHGWFSFGCATYRVALTV